MNGFLFDSNLPSLIQFTPAFPVIHARSLGDNPTDTDLWEYARLHDLTIVSKDADFSNRIIVQSAASCGSFALRKSATARVP